MPTHVALLRGVNIGRGKRLAMPDLRAAVEALGHDDVATHVQSGNVVLSAHGRPSAADLAAQLRGAIADATGIDAPVIVLTASQWHEVVAQNPYPDEQDGTKLHAVVRQQPYPAAERTAAESIRDEVRESGSDDDLTVVGRVAYLHLPNGLGRSVLATRLGRSKAAGQREGTARNWRTVLALEGMLRA